MPERGIFKRHGRERFQGGEWTSQCVSPPVRPQQGPGSMQQSRARYCTMRFRLLPAGRSRIGLLRNWTPAHNPMQRIALADLLSGRSRSVRTSETVWIKIATARASRGRKDCLATA
jgi:hypothetical protein